MADFFFTLAFLFLVAGIASIGMAFWCVSQDYGSTWYDRGPGFLVGFGVSMILAFIFFIPGAIISDNEWNDWAKAKCAESGGYLMNQYHSDPLCISEDGRIIPNWKK